MNRSEHPYIYRLFYDDEWDDGSGRWCFENATTNNVIEQVKLGHNVEIECEGAIYRLMFVGINHCVFGSIGLDNSDENTAIISRDITIMVLGIDFNTQHIASKARSIK